MPGAGEVSLLSRLYFASSAGGVSAANSAIACIPHEQSDVKGRLMAAG